MTTSKRKMFILLVPVTIAGMSTSILWVSLPFRLSSVAIPLALLGLLSSANDAGGLFIQLPTSILADIIGRKNVIVLGAIVLSLAIFIISLTTSIVTLTLAIILMAAGYSMISSPVSLLLYESSEPRLRGKMASYNLFAVSLGGTAALALSGEVNVSLHLSLSALYVAFSAVVLIIAIFLTFIRVDEPRVLEDEKSSQHNRMSFKGLVEEFSILSNFFRNNGFFRRFVIIQILLTFCWGSTLVFIPALGLKFGLSESSVFFLFAVIGVTSLFFTIEGGRMSDRYPRKYFFLLRPVTVLIPFLIVALAINIAFLIGGIIMVETWQLFAPGNRVFIFDQYTDRERSLAHGAALLVTQITGVAAPLVGILLWSISFRLLFGLTALLAVPAFFISLDWLRKVNS